MKSPRFVRVAETQRGTIPFRLDGEAVFGLEGDTILTAVLTNADRLRVSEFADGARAGFCLMGACQDCWMWTESGRRLRACTTRLEAGLELRTVLPEEKAWPNGGS